MVEEPFDERFWREIDEAFEAYDLPNELVENLKKDLKNAFRVRGKARPGYEPGAVARVGINLIDAVTNPLETAAKTFGAFTGEISRPPVPLAWTDAEGDVWKKLFATEWVDAQGYGVLPRSVEDAVLRWNEGARDRGTRLTREGRGIFENPGLTLMMAEGLSRAGVTHVAGVGITTIIAEARVAEREVTSLLKDADLALRAGDRGGAEKAWREAGERQKEWAKQSKAYQDSVRREFERQSRLGSRAGAPQAAYDLANSPEAQFWRSWKNRRLYFQTLNFLNTWREDGFWGMFRTYAWQEFIRRAFPEEVKWRYYLYPPNLISGAVGWLAERAKVTQVMTRITDWRQRFKNFWKEKIGDRLTNALNWVREEVIRKAVSWLIAKLGRRVVITKLRALIGSAVGSIVPGIGNVLAAVGAAILSFIGGIVVEKVVQPVLKWTAVFFAGACTCLALTFGGMVFFAAILVGSVFAPGAGGPEVPPEPSPTPVLVEVDKKVGTATEPFQERLYLDNNRGWQTVFWQIIVTNVGSKPATVTNFQDDFCEGYLGDEWETSFALDPGEQKELPIPCEIGYNTDVLNDTIIYNTASGEATVEAATKTISDTAMIIIGKPEACIVSDVPYYCQCGEPYSDVECVNYPGRTVCSFGCGPASEAMLINYHCGGTVTDPGEIAQNYGCGAITLGATADILGGGLSTGSFGDDADDVTFFAPLLTQLCADRPVITTIKHPELNSGHISLIVGIDITNEKIILNDSYVSCVLGGVGAYAEYDFDDYSDWVNTDTYRYWGGALHPDCSP